MTTVGLIIDMQADFFRYERLQERRASLVANTNALTAILREAGVPVIWVRQEFAPDLSDASLEVRRLGIRIVVAGTPGAALLPELAARDPDMALVKKRYSAFFGTDLDGILHRLRCERLVIAGINTHACVRAAAVDANQRDYDVVLARDCIDSHDGEQHAATWRYMDGKPGRGMDNAQIRSLLAGA